MTCERYRDFWLGDMSADEFAEHRGICRACDEAAAMDARIEDEARRLTGPASAPGLWDRIAADLAPPARRDGPRAIARRRSRQVPGGAWSLAAVLVACVALGAAWILRPDAPGPRPGNLLAAEALASVEAMEAEYVTAIEALEAVAAPVLASADTRLRLRYRERLEIIDAQIADCRAALARDNANAHIRRYLLAAYRDKSETLTELLALASG